MESDAGSLRGGAQRSWSGVYNVFPAPTIVLLAAAGLKRDGAVLMAGCVQFVLCPGFFALLGLAGS